MATTKTPRSPRNTRTGSNAMNIQKKINSDYGELARDYKKLAIELWNNRTTKFVLAGVALGAIATAFSRIPQVNSMVRDGVDGIRSKVDSVMNSGEDLIS